MTESRRQDHVSSPRLEICTQEGPVTDENAATPEQQAALDRARARIGQSIDPVVVGVLKRALEVARRNELSTITLKEVLEAFLHATITPALINRLQEARSIAEDERGSEYVYVDDVSTFAAQLADPTSLVYQIVELEVDDMEAFVARVWQRVRATSPSGDS
jgi:hypothetical protein